jgi:hypothetical protein
MLPGPTINLPLHAPEGPDSYSLCSILHPLSPGVINAGVVQKVESMLLNSTGGVGRRGQILYVIA